MPVRPLPPNPTLAPLLHEAEDLLRTHADRLPATAQRLREFHPRFAHLADPEIFRSPLTLDDARLATARERGFPTWTRLERRIANPTLADRLDLPLHDRIEDPLFRQALALLDLGEIVPLRTLLLLHPMLIHQHALLEGTNYFQSPTLLDFIAENPLRHGTLPPNIVEVTRTLLEARPTLAAINETLTLVATGSVARECAATRPLIDLLCAHGADPNLAIRPAAVLAEHDAVLALIHHGARVDLPIAAALGRLADCESLLPTASPADRHLALTVAANFGHANILRLLLDAGEDPNRYNPPGGHSHGTPLHLAAGNGHEAAVKLLVARGARLDQQDILWHATPADWAAHEGKSSIEAFLRAAAANPQ